MPDMQTSLYIHVPFCSSFCDYCDFYSVEAGKLNDDFISALVTDIKFQIEYFNVGEISTVYIGGGTPSVLGEKVSVLLDALKKILGFSPVEFTIEANPESLTEGFLRACVEGGVNRLSLGVQTFFEPSRLAVNRNYLSADLRGFSRMEEKIALAAEFFPCALSVDLITGLPFQDEKVVVDDIKKVLEFKPAHVSLYSLSVESGTLLEEKLKAGTVSLPNSDLADSMWLTGRDALLNAGFEHYEVSNFALPGKRCLHNMSYWQMAGWLGAGPAASGTIVNEQTGTAKRFTYPCDVESYVKSPCVLNAECEELDRSAFLKESLLMGFRCVDGPDPVLFKQRFGLTVEECIPQTLARWKEKDKMLFLNAFLADAFKELVRGFTRIIAD